MKKVNGFLLCLCMAASMAVAQEEEGESPFSFEEGPSVGDMGVAQIQIPEGFSFANAETTKLLMDAMQNPVTGREVGFVAKGEEEWFVVFEYEDSGYVKDDEKGDLDADAMLKSIQAGTEQGNEERKRRGWASLHVTGWEMAPRYNEETQLLEWATRLESEGQPGVNFNTRVLGRGGVMSVTLVCDPDSLQTILPTFKGLLGDFEYKSGETYAEYKEGDKLAKYGLTALVVGGAGALAAKSGLFKWLGKILVVGAVAVGAFFKKLFGGKSA